MFPVSDASVDILLLFSEPPFFVQNRDDATSFTSTSEMLSTCGGMVRRGYLGPINRVFSHLAIFPCRALMTAILAWTPPNS